MPGDSDDLGIEVINVHAPSGTRLLTDAQRRTLFWNLLQSSSKVPEPQRRQDRCPPKTIGEVKFLIGGDTNTSELGLCQILNDLNQSGTLKVSFEVMRPTWGLHGDICVVGGCNQDNTKIATGQAKNHDPQHLPYGIWWCSQSEHATEQLTPISEVKAGSTSTTGEATKQSSSWTHQRAVPQPESTNHATEQPQLDEERTPLLRGPDQYPKPMSEKRDQYVAPAYYEVRASSSGPESTNHATEQPQLDEDRTPVFSDQYQDPKPMSEKRDQYVARAYYEERASSSGHATEQPQITENLLREKSPEAQASLHVAYSEQTAGHATEQPQPDTEDIPTLDKPEQELAYLIVNTFLDNPTLQSTEAEKIIKGVIVEQKQWSAEVLDSIDEVFRPVFVQYTNGLQDKTRWTARDPAPYIREWRNTAEWRDRVLQAGANAEGKQFSREQVAPILHHITEDFIENHADDAQKMDKRTRNKSRAEARLNRLCGSRHVANAIWQLGLPKVLSPAATACYRAASIETDTVNVLQWLAKLAEVIQSHKATSEYQENTRKSGDSHGKSGLTPAEMETRLRGKKWTKKW